MNIYDIAKLAGVSIATVSRVISGNPKVRPETRRNVEEVMRLNNYSPSLIARGMNSKSLKTVAIAVLSFADSHHMRITHEIVRFFSTLDYNVVIYEAGSSIEDIMSFCTRMKNMSIDGIILVSSVFSLFENNFDEALKIIGDKPVIIANGWVNGMYGIIVDEDYGCKKAVEHLHSQGLNRIYYFKSTYTQSSERKCRGYHEAIEENGLEELVINLRSGYEDEDVLASVQKIEIDPKNTAIICDEDVLAVHVMKFLKEKNIAIPDDVSVIGYNDSLYCNLVLPHLSTIDNKASILGQKCAEYLSTALKGGDLGEKKILEHIQPRLVIRGSSV